MTTTTHDTGTDRPAPSGLRVTRHANDLVHIGRDTAGANHYQDCETDTIYVVDAVHDEYVPADSVLIRRALDVAAADVVDVIDTPADHDIQTYIEFVRKDVDDRDWDEIVVNVIGGGL